MNSTYNHIEAVLRAAEHAAPTAAGKSRVHNITIYACGYAEPGYPDEPCPVALGDWNAIVLPVSDGVTQVDNTPIRTGKLLERAGVDLQWYDEWIACDVCGRLVRTQPNSYSWRASYWMDEDATCLCAECTFDDTEDYLQSHENRPRQAVTLRCNPALYGYHLWQAGLANGFHPGQDDDPALLADQLRSLGATRFLFTLDGTGQFDLEFSVYVHDDDWEKCKHLAAE